MVMVFFRCTTISAAQVSGMFTHIEPEGLRAFEHRSSHSYVNSRYSSSLIALSSQACPVSCRS
jgi:hypothetical protein